MAKGYIVADIHVRDKEGFEKFKKWRYQFLKNMARRFLFELLTLKLEKERNQV